MKGRSLVMSKSRYTSVRKRDDALEITLRRGVTGSEIDNVISRLTSHRLVMLEAAWGVPSVIRSENEVVSFYRPFSG